MPRKKQVAVVKDEPNYVRLCISLPRELCEELKGSYPHIQFSSLLTQLLMYAHAAGFLKRLDEITPARPSKPTPPPAVKPLPLPSIEEFGL